MNQVRRGCYDKVYVGRAWGQEQVEVIEPASVTGGRWMCWRLSPRGTVLCAVRWREYATKGRKGRGKNEGGAEKSPIAQLHDAGVWHKEVGKQWKMFPR